MPSRRPCGGHPSSRRASPDLNLPGGTTHSIAAELPSKWWAARQVRGGAEDAGAKTCGGVVGIVVAASHPPVSTLKWDATHPQFVQRTAICSLCGNVIDY